MSKPYIIAEAAQGYEGSPELSEEELTYRGNALKRVVAAGDLPMGHVLTRECLRLNRPASREGFYRMDGAIGRTLARAVSEGDPIDEQELLS